MEKIDKNKNKQFKRIMLLTIAVAIVAITILVVIFLAPNELKAYFASPFVNSEVVYLMLALCIIVPISLIFLLISSLSASRELRRTMKKAGKGAKKIKKKHPKKKGVFRFVMLNRIDKENASYKPPEKKAVTLKDFCLAFRDYAAGNLGLYYDISDIRRFVAGMSVTRLILLQGMSGTGKTSLAYAMGQFIENDSVVVPIQPMWKERSDMIGYFNEFTKKFNETTLLRKMYEAGYRKELYITILDEVNISRIEYYFAEFLSLLELPDENGRYLDVVSDVWEGDPAKLKDGKIKLPPNMWFVGTANNDDSTFAISDKVYDRAMVLSLDSRCVPFEAAQCKGIRIPYSQWCELVGDAKKRYSLSLEAEKKVKELDLFLIERLRLSFGNRIMKQIKEYVPVMIACGGTEMGAIDDILARKVLRKLEQQNPVHIRSVIPELISFTEEIFGEDLPLCLDYLRRFETNLEM